MHAMHTLHLYTEKPINDHHLIRQILSFDADNDAREIAKSRVDTTHFKVNVFGSHTSFSELLIYFN